MPCPRSLCLSVRPPACLIVPSLPYLTTSSFTLERAFVCAAMSRNAPSLLTARSTACKRFGSTFRSVARLNWPLSSRRCNLGGRLSWDCFLFLTLRLHGVFSFRAFPCRIPIICVLVSRCQARWPYCHRVGSYARCMQREEGSFYCKTMQRMRGHLIWHVYQAWAPPLEGGNSEEGDSISIVYRPIHHKARSTHSTKYSVGGRRTNTKEFEVSTQWHKCSKPG